MTVPTTLGGAEYARLEPARLSAVVGQAVRAAHGSAVCVRTSSLNPVAYEIGTISTCALLRASGEATVDGSEQDWSVFVKVLQSARVWPFLHLIPASAREVFVADFPWRLEIEAHRSPLRDVLPDGLRLPDLYDVVEMDADHAAMWMEDVNLSPDVWSIDTFVRAADLLGELAGRRPPGTDAVFGDPRYADDPGCALRLYAEGRVLHWAGGGLQDDRIWEHPAMVAALSDVDELARPGSRGLRADLTAAFEALPTLFERVEALPVTYVHGDASPQNLLVSTDRPDEFVVIDWGFNCPLAVGFDLGQLLVGLAHAGELSVDEMPAIHEAIVPAYLRGLSRSGCHAAEEDVMAGYVGSLMIRSGFTAMPYEIFESPDLEDSSELRARLRERAELTRFVLELTRSALPDVLA